MSTSSTEASKETHQKEMELLSGKDTANLDKFNWECMFSLSQDSVVGHYLKFKTEQHYINARLNTFSLR